jgi:hypothetical protein
MSKPLNLRVTAAEASARAAAPKLFVTKIQGGLPGPIRCGKIDGVHMARLPEESVNVFEERILAAAKNAKAASVVFGGLCGCAWQTKADFEANLKNPDFRRFDENGIAVER